MFGRAAELLDEIARHALLEVLAAAEDRDAARVGGEVHRRLSRRVACADDMDVEAVGGCRLAASRTVEDALSGKPVDPLDGQAPPRDAAREDDRPRSEDVAAVEVYLAGRGIDARDRPRHDDLRAEPPRLPQRTARQLVAGDTSWKAEIVLDPRRRPRLTARSLAFDDDRSQALGSAVHRRRQPGGSRADDHRVVLRCKCLGAEPEQFGDPSKLRPNDRLAVDDPNHRAISLRR